MILGFWIGFVAGVAWSYWLDMTYEPKPLPENGHGSLKDVVNAPARRQWRRNGP